MQNRGGSCPEEPIDRWQPTELPVKAVLKRQEPFTLDVGEQAAAALCVFVFESLKRATLIQLMYAATES